MSDWLDGPALYAWINNRREVNWLELGGYKSYVKEWRDGQPANVYVADRVLLRIGMHLSELPDSLYLAAPLEVAA